MDLPVSALLVLGLQECTTMPIIFCVDSGRSDSCPHACQVSTSPMEASSSPIVLRDWKHNLQLFPRLHFIFWCYCWVFWHTEVLSLVKSRLFSFFACTFGLISKNVLSNLNAQRFFPLCFCFSSEIWIFDPFWVNFYMQGPVSVSLHPITSGKDNTICG